MGPETLNLNNLKNLEVLERLKNLEFVDYRKPSNYKEYKNFTESKVTNILNDREGLEDPVRSKSIES